MDYKIDDLVLLAPSQHSMRQMLRICEDYAGKYDKLFNTSQSKSIVCNPKFSNYSHRYCLLPHFVICGSRPTIEVVDSWSHLGHVISKVCDDKRDIMNRRTRFISQVNNIICVFGKLDCVTKMRLFKAYCSSFMTLNSGISLMTVCRHWVRPGAMHLDEFSTFHSLPMPIPIFSIYWTTTHLSTMYFVNDH